MRVIFFVIFSSFCGVECDGDIFRGLVRKKNFFGIDGVCCVVVFVFPGFRIPGFSHSWFFSFLVFLIPGFSHSWFSVDSVRVFVWNWIRVRVRVRVPTAEGKGFSIPA